MATDSTVAPGTATLDVPANVEVDLGSGSECQELSVSEGQGASVVSVRSSSRVSLRDAGNFQFSDYLASSFYSYREGALDKAVDDICRVIVKPEVDGTLLGSWLLLEVDHWDAETEKVVVLTEHTVFSVRYDFVAMKPYRFKKVPLCGIDSVQFGDFVYPKVCLASNKRTGGGVRLYWNRGTPPSFLNRWRTSDDAVPWMTFTHHHLLGLPKESENVRYNCDDYCKRLISAVQLEHNAAAAAAGTAAQFKVIEAPLELTVYLGLHSLVYNQSFLGVSKERGGFSF